MTTAAPIYWILLLCLFFSCGPSANHTEDTHSTTEQKPSHVEISKIDGKYEILVNGKPYKVKGAGINFPDGANFKALAAAGGNTFRTWTTDSLVQELDSAVKYNLMVAVGLSLDKELHGFDYTDTAAVAEQLERVKKTVNTYKNHPNILCWVAGNELNLLFNEDGSLGMVHPRTYRALADIVDYIHEVDPHHPVTSSLAGVTKSHIDMALENCPNLDFLAVQVYGDLQNIAQHVADGNLTKPFMVTEFGPLGHWERPATDWGREIEEESAVKAAGLAKRIEMGILEDSSGLNIGNFAFEWGQKQERTPTWYGMFNKSGEATARIDELTKYWTGEYPENRAPLTDSMKIDNRKAVDNIYLKPGVTYDAEVFIRELDNDSLTYDWVILKEVQTRSQGGAFEQEPDAVKFEVLSDANGKLSFVSPEEEGDYRLFSYAYDGNGKVGNANVPFYVKP